jgi:hypothetical protein
VEGKAIKVLIWIGAALTLAGLALLVWLIRSALGLRKAELSEEEKRAELARLGPLNFGALALSMFGLIMVVVGLALS